MNSYATLYTTLRRRKLSLVDLAILELTQDESRTPSALANELGVSAPLITERVRRLRKLGLVRSRQGEANRRKMWILATNELPKILTQQPTNTHQP